MTGEQLYGTFRTRLLSRGAIASHIWQGLAAEVQNAWNDLAAWAERAAMFQHFPTTPAVDWRELLRRYGRHRPDCPASAPCVCGFTEVERELNAEFNTMRPKL